VTAAPGAAWQRLLSGPWAESATLCRGDGGREGVTAAGGPSSCLSSGELDAGVEDRTLDGVLVRSQTSTTLVGRCCPLQT